jgi:hypothetical protein
VTLAFQQFPYKKFQQVLIALQKPHITAENTEVSEENLKTPLPFSVHSVVKLSLPVSYYQAFKAL